MGETNSGLVALGDIDNDGRADIGISTYVTSDSVTGEVKRHAVGQIYLGSTFSSTSGFDWTAPSLWLKQAHRCTRHLSRVLSPPLNLTNLGYLDQAGGTEFAISDSLAGNKLVYPAGHALANNILDGSNNHSV